MSLFFKTAVTSSKTVICIILNQFATKFKNSLFSQKGMYKWYLLKYFGTFTVFIDHTVIKFQKHWLINHSNTKGDPYVIVTISVTRCT